MALDWRALGYAILIEACLLVLAAFGGPHGQLGAVPWALQLPGMLLVLYPPGGALFVMRVALAAVVQVGLWYVILSRLRRRRARGAKSAPLWAGIGLLLFSPLPLEAQAPATLPRRIQWPLLDLIAFPDSCVGLRVMVAPNPASTAWLAGTHQVQLGLDPVEALQWTTVARRLTERAAAVTGEPDTVARLTPPLRPRRGGQFLLLAVNGKLSAPDERYIFVVSDSGSNTRWKAFASLAQVDSLLAALEDAAELARAIPIANDAGQALAEDDPGVERPVKPEFIPAPEYPSELWRKGRVGRVWMQYIVGPDGRAEKGSFRALLSDDPLFTTAAAQAIYRARFKPALAHGAPVRQRVFQTVAFRLRG